MKSNVLFALLCEKLNPTGSTALNDSLHYLCYEQADTANILAMGVLGIGAPACDWTINQVLTINPKTSISSRAIETAIPVTITSINRYDEKVTIAGTYTYEQKRSSSDVATIETQTFWDTDMSFANLLKSIAEVPIQHEEYTMAS